MTLTGCKNTVILEKSKELTRKLKKKKTRILASAKIRVVSFVFYGLNIRSVLYRLEYYEDGIELPCHWWNF